jgi:hypothetical protein
MRKQVRDAVGRVLREAARARHFFDLSDAERLNWMIARAFELGRRTRDVSSVATPRIPRGSSRGEDRSRVG